MNYSLGLRENRSIFVQGMRDGVPIGLGYLAVSFSLGIAARNVGFTSFQGFLVSILCNASAGEYVGFTMVGAAATFLEMAIAIFIANARYILMSCAMSQRISKDLGLRHRMLMSFYITDEIFGISIAREGYLNPNYTYGAALIASPLWGLGTALGIIAGNMLPPILVSAFSVALYGMFLAVIIPQAKVDKIVSGIIIMSFALSFFSGFIPILSEFSDGTRIIVLTAVISAFSALLFPKKEESMENE